MDRRVGIAPGNDVLLACTIGDLTWLKRGLSNGIEPTTANEEGLNGLHLAAKYGQVECVKYMLDNCSIDVNCSSLSTGSSALHYSIAHMSAAGSLQCTKLLLSHGGSIKSQNKLGETPLHIAAKRGHSKLVKLFLEMGASIQTKDKKGQTPYDTACVHNQHECARLLRALQWANKKDFDDREKLQKEEIRKRETNARLALQERLRKEAADVSYNGWLMKKGMKSCGQSTRKKEAENYSRPTLSSHGASKQRPITLMSNPQFTSTIKLNPKQAKRNLTSIGKPEKMQPYTNYPLKSSLRRTSLHGLSKSRSEPSKSGRSSRVTVRSAASVPAGVRYYSSKVHHLHATTQQQNDKQQTKKVITECTEESHESRDCKVDKEMELFKHQPTGQVEDSSCTDSLDRVTSQSAKVEGNEQQLTVSQTALEDNHNVQRVEDKDEDIRTSDESNCYFQPQEEEDDELDFSKLVKNDVFNDQYSIGEEEDLFHDVGQTNSLNALSLPNTLTKDRTPAELVQLFRSLGGLSRYNRSNSFSHSYSVAHRNRFQRRLSLGAIPEGKIVTSYSDDEQSTSQILDGQFLESLIFNIGGDVDSRKENDNIQHAATRQCLQDGGNDSEEELESLSDGSETLSGSTMSSSSVGERLVDCDELCYELRDSSKSDIPKVEVSHVQDDSSPQVSHPRSLKVVNLAWDPFSNTVESHISESPLSPPDFSNRSGRWTPTRKLTPPNKNSNSHSQSPRASFHSSFSHSPRNLTPSSSTSSLLSQEGLKFTPSPPSHSDAVQGLEPGIEVEEFDQIKSLTSIHEESLMTLSSHSLSTLTKLKGEPAGDHEIETTACRRFKSAPTIML